MKKLIIGFLTGVLVTIPIMLMIQEPKALEPEIVYVTPPPQPTPTPQIIYKERLTDLEQVVANTKDSCVMIYAYRSDGSGEQGSGWAYGDYIVTAKHVVEEAKKIEIITDNSNSASRGTIEYIDDELDVAILKLNTRTLPSVTLGDSDTLIEGEKLVAITSPQGVKNAIDECVNSGFILFDDGKFLTVSEGNMIGGSSGGAVFNYESELVAMVAYGNEGGNHAIPVNSLKPILEKLK